MAKVFFCGDVISGCDAQFTSESEEEILSQVAEHARARHGIDPVPQDVIRQVRERIRDT